MKESIASTTQGIATVPVPPFRYFRFTFSSTKGYRFKRYPGSDWRGVFGEVLRHQSCLTDMPTCRGCRIISHCAYAQIFESTVGTPTHLMHPYVLRPQWHAQDEQRRLRHRVFLTVVQPAFRYIPLLVETLERAGRQGLGKSRIELHLESVETLTSEGWVRGAGEDSPPDAALMPKRARFTLLSTLRLSTKSSPGGIAGAAEMTPRRFLAAIPRRLAALSGQDRNTRERYLPQHLAAEFDACDLYPVADDRYSGRQKRRHDMSGIGGHFDLTMEGMEKLWPAIWAGQYLHVGGKTAFGFGAYRVTDL